MTDGHKHVELFWRPLPGATGGGRVDEWRPLDYMMLHHLCWRLWDSDAERGACHPSVTMAVGSADEAFLEGLDQMNCVGASDLRAHLRIAGTVELYIGHPGGPDK